MIAALERPYSPVAVLRREHKQLLDRLSPPTTPTRVRCCAAQLISYFKHWHEWKEANYPTSWIYQPLTEIRHDLMDAYTVHVIRDAIALLHELGFLSVRKNDRALNWRNGQDKTHQYLLHSDRIEAALENRFSQPIAETLEKSPFVNTETSGVNVEISNVNVEISRFTVETHTQIPSLIPATDSCTLSEEQERIDFVQEIEDPWGVPAKEVRQELMNSCKKVEEEISQEDNSGLDQNSAAPAVKCDELVQIDVKPLPKLKSDRTSGFRSDDERNGFYKVLLELGKSQGKKSPVAWSAAIIKSINAGDPCQYLLEYREGLLVGACEKQEWEIAPGQPYPKFISYLKARLKKTGMTDEEVIAAAHRQLSDVNAARSQWESCKRSIAAYQEEWERQKRLGVQNAYLPPELLPNRDVSVEQLTGAIASLQAGCVQLGELAESYTPVQELEPAQDQEPAKELEGAESKSEPAPAAGLESEPKPKPTMAELQEKLNSLAMAPAIRMMVKFNPQWGYRIEEDLVLPLEGTPSLEYLRSLHGNVVTARRVHSLVEKHPEWGYYFENGELCDF